MDDPLGDFVGEIQGRRKVKNLGMPLLKDLDRINHFGKAPLYLIWEILGGPVHRGFFDPICISLK